MSEQFYIAWCSFFYIWWELWQNRPCLTSLENQVILGRLKPQLLIPSWSTRQKVGLRTLIELDSNGVGFMEVKPYLSDVAKPDSNGVMVIEAHS